MIRTRIILIAFLLIHSISITYSQTNKPVTPPVPAEFLFGNERLYFQMVVKKPFRPESRFAYFGLATFNAGYTNDPSDNEIVIPVQASYTIWKGFGIMTGATINSKSGFSAVAGPQHNFASRNFLAVTVLSCAMNAEKSAQLFGLYEYKPPVNDRWSGYTRLQFIYNHGLKDNIHQKSYLQLRAGLRYRSVAFGAGANMDRYGEERIKKNNFGIFLRWEFLN